MREFTPRLRNETKEKENKGKDVQIFSYPCEFIFNEQ